MEKLLINTPQNVDIEYSLASVGSRILAIALDYAVMIGYAFLIFKIIELFFSHTMDSWLYMGTLMLFLLPVLFYHFILETLLKGQTLGMMVVKLKVVKIDGSRATIYEYFIRWVMNIVDIWMLSGVIGLVFIISTKKSQRIGDLAAGTTIINLKPKLKLIETVYEELKDSYEIQFPQVVKLSDKDINIVKKSFKNAVSKRDTTVINALATKLKNVLEIQDVKISNEKFVETVIKDHYHSFKER